MQPIKHLNATNQPDSNSNHLVRKGHPILYKVSSIFFYWKINDYLVLYCDVKYLVGFFGLLIEFLLVGDEPNLLKLELEKFWSPNNECCEFEKECVNVSEVDTDPADERNLNKFDDDESFLVGDFITPSNLESNEYSDTCWPNSSYLIKLFIVIWFSWDTSFFIFWSLETSLLSIISNASSKLVDNLLGINRSLIIWDSPLLPLLCAPELLFNTVEGEENLLGGVLIGVLGELDEVG